MKYVVVLIIINKTFWLIDSGRTLDLSCQYLSLVWKLVSKSKQMIFIFFRNVWKYWLYAFFSVQKQDFVLFIDVSTCVYSNYHIGQNSFIKFLSFPFKWVTFVSFQSTSGILWKRVQYLWNYFFQLFLQVLNPNNFFPIWILIALMY